MKRAPLVQCICAAVTVLFAMLLVRPVWSGVNPLPVFTAVTESAGINFVHSFGDADLNNIVESTGAGVAFLDYDGDGDLDIYFVNGSYHPTVNHPKGRLLAGKLQNALYRNDGGGVFKDVTGIAGVGDTEYGMACTAADYDNDGDADIYVTNYGKNRLYLNNGDGTFSDGTDRAGVGCDRWSVGCAFLDYDRDGFLDLFVGNYLNFDPEYQNFYAGDAFPGPLAYSGQADVLYRNRGDGTFEDVSEKTGINNPHGRAMGVAARDVDDDGFMDIYVANDGMENYLYRNQGDGSFANIALVSGTAFGQNGEATSAMCSEMGDFNGDGRMDILVPDMGYGCLYLNQGGTAFIDASAKLGLAAACGQYTSWSGNFFDFDNDGWIDVLLTNGDSRFYEPEEDLLLQNIEGQRLVDVSRQLGPDFQKKHMGRGSAVGDMDGDGDLDMVILNMGAEPVLYRNDGGNLNHWLMIQVKGRRSNRDGIGTRIRLYHNGKIQTRDVTSSSGYLSQSDYRVHFGLGAGTTVERIEIRWPDGKIQKLFHISADQLLVVDEP